LEAAVDAVFASFHVKRHNNGSPTTFTVLGLPDDIPWTPTLLPVDVGFGCFT
jgi:hypothetical protein